MKKRVHLCKRIVATLVSGLLAGLPGRSFAASAGETVSSVAANIPVVPLSLGDVDGSGEITANDALVILQGATQKIVLTPEQQSTANVDGQEGITANDALLVLQFATKKINAFPGEEPLMALTEYIDMTVGTANSTNTVIGPQRPNASVNPAPDAPGYLANGYNSRSDTLIRGFSQIHVSGTGVGKYGQVLLSPQVGLSTRLDGHDSAKSNEKATCSEYSVTLDEWGIDCAFTCTENVNIFKFHYPKATDATLLVDMAHNNAENNNKGHHTGIYNESSDIRLQIGTDEQGQTTVFGSGYYEGGWGRPHYVYFYAVADTAPTAVGVYDREGAHEGTTAIGPVTISDEATRNAGLGAYLQFDTTTDREVTFKVAMSLKSVEQAKSYMQSELPDWDYDGVKADTDALWNRELNRILIDGESLDDTQKTVFYTAMYHSMVMPRYRTGDIEVYGDAVMLDDHFAGWDTFRTVMPLYTLIKPSLMEDILNSFITRYKVNGYVRDSMTGGQDMYEQQGGDNVDVIIADAWAKLKDTDAAVDWEAAYEIVRNHADNYRLSWQGKQNDFADNVVPDPDASYKTLGYIPGDDATEKIMCCNYTLDYAYNDYCAALMARELGTQTEYERYLERSGNWENLWNPDLTYGDYTGFIGPRAADGEFIDISVTRNWGSWKEYFYEASSYNYSFYVPQNPERLIELCGGEEAFCDRLYEGIMDGHVDFGNEPAFLAAFLFAYTDSPYLTADCVAKVRSRFSLSGNGGNDDSGALSAWYIFTTMGLFPCAGQDFYYLTSPAVERTTLKLENGKTLTVRAEGLSKTNAYIQAVTVNGEAYYGNTIPHAMLANGGEIVFTMGERRIDYTEDVEWKTVTFEENGGTDVENQWVAEGKPTREPEAPVRKGYTFGGWYTGTGYATKWDFADPVNGDMTLYAHWVEAPVLPESGVTLATVALEPLSKNTLEGDDWAFYGYGDELIHKEEGTGVFTGMAAPAKGELTVENMQAYNAGHSPYFSWTEGTPTATGTDVRYIIWNDTGLYIPVTVAARQEVTLYISGVRAAAYLEVVDEQGQVLLRQDMWGSASARSYQKATLSFDRETGGNYQIRLMVDQENRQSQNYSVSLFAATASAVLH